MTLALAERGPISAYLRESHDRRYRDAYYSGRRWSDAYLRTVIEDPEVWKRPPTYLYCIEEIGGPVKIGVARNPRERHYTLQIANPREISLLAAFPGTQKLEKLTHRFLAAHRVRGEWFALDPPVIEVIEVFIATAEMCIQIASDGEGDATVDEVEAMFADWVAA